MTPNEAAMPFEKWSNADLYEKERSIDLDVIGARPLTDHIRRCYAEIDRLQSGDVFMDLANQLSVLKSAPGREVKALRRVAEAASAFVDAIAIAIKETLPFNVSERGKELYDALAALDAAPSTEGEGWRMIEREPKQYEKVLIFQNGIVSIGFMSDPALNGLRSFWQYAVSEKYCSPTHWMPLPSPPSSTQKGGL